MAKEKISKFNQKAVEKFINYLKISYDNPQTLTNQRNNLIMLFSKTNKKYTEITLNNIIEILSNLKPTTAEVMKPTIRKFFKHYNKTKISKNIPSNSKVLSRQTKGIESVLTPEEINKIIETPNELRDKAIIETFLTTGIRNNELRNLKLSDIDINDNITTWIKIHRTKTNTNNTEQKIPIVRNSDNPIAKFPKYLRQWYKINEHLPQDTYLFYSKSRNKYQKQLSKRGIQIIIENAQKNSKINKKITPHIFRHTAATHDGKNLVQNMMCQKYGWKLHSKMLEKYCHHNEKQLEHELLKLAGLTEKDQKKGQKCPNCEEINNINEEICKKCHQIIDPDKLKEIYEKNLEEGNEQKQIAENYYRDKIKYEKEIDELKNDMNTAIQKFSQFMQLENFFNRFGKTKDGTLYITNYNTETNTPQVILETDTIVKKDKKLQRQFEKIKKAIKESGIETKLDKTISNQNKNNKEIKKNEPILKKQ